MLRKCRCPPSPARCHHCTHPGAHCHWASTGMGMDCLQHSGILVYPFAELLCNHYEPFGLPVHKTGHINSACSQPCADLQGSCFSQVSLFCGDQKTRLTLQTTMQQHRAWPNETAVMPYNGLVPGQGGAPGVSYRVVQLQPEKVTGRERGYMLPPCTFTLLPLLLFIFSEYPAHCIAKTALP